MNKWKKRWRSPRFYAEIAVFCLIVFLIFSISNKDNKDIFSNVFDKSQYLFSQGDSIIEGFDLNVVEGSFLETYGPPFLVSGKSLASFSDFSSSNEIQQYVVEDGDTLSSIAEKFKISVATITEANNLSNNATLNPGKQLTILPVTGLLHIIGPGDTLSEISELYQVKANDVVEANYMADPGDIYVGDLLIVPGGKKPRYMANFVQVPLAGNYFMCPVPSPCRISQGLHWYNAIDFSNGKCGEPVFAAAGGTVQRTGSTSVSGRYVRIMHPNSVVTFYGHLSKISVAGGQKVSQGQIIGYVGYSGVTVPAGPAGCHLHFDVRFAKNPFSIYNIGTYLGN